MKRKTTVRRQLACRCLALCLAAAGTMTDDGDTAKSLRNVNLIVGKYAKVQIPSKATVTFRDIDLTDSTSVLSVNAAQVSIRTMRHKDGRRWKGTYDLGGTTVNPGRLLWVGGVTHERQMQKELECLG